ncbi:MAG: hypothetical protein ACR2NP_12945 [Pirellulaceae bacterium]
MLYALLFDGQDRLIAAAPAALQHATGDSYWRDSYAGRIQFTEDCQTAYVEIDDPLLRDMLDSLPTDDRHLQACGARIEALIHSGDGPKSSSGHPRAA